MNNQPQYQTPGTRLISRILTSINQNVGLSRADSKSRQARHTNQRNKSYFQSPRVLLGVKIACKWRWRTINDAGRKAPNLSPKVSSWNLRIVKACSIQLPLALKSEENESRGISSTSHFKVLTATCNSLRTVLLDYEKFRSRKPHRNPRTEIYQDLAVCCVCTVNSARACPGQVRGSMSCS